LRRQALTAIFHVAVAAFSFYAPLFLALLSASCLVVAGFEEKSSMALLIKLPSHFAPGTPQYLGPYKIRDRAVKVAQGQRDQLEIRAPV
jgi:hypothetical protein